MNAFAKPNLAVDQIPSASAADKDKVLTIDANGVPVWAENQGGGTGGGVLVATDTVGTLDKTWQEIHDAMLSTGAVYVSQNGGVSSFVFAGSSHVSGYHVDTAMGDEFYTDSADGYPAIDGGGQI